MSDVPAAMNTSQVHAVDAAFRSAGDSDSPNQTTPGRASPPHPGHVAGCAGSGTRSSRHGRVPQRFQQASSQIDPCSRTRRCVPDRMCRSSTFCVMTVHVVPLPHQRRIARECFGCGEIFGPERSPQPARSTECRDTARCGYASTGQHRHTSRLFQASSQLLEHAIILVVRARYCLS